MEKKTSTVIDQSLQRLADPALSRLKSSAQLRKVLTEARETGDLPKADLSRAVRDLIDELDVPRRAAKYSGGSDQDAVEGGFAILFLLILLTILMALAGDTDLAALIDELIQALLDALKGA